MKKLYLVAVLLLILLAAVPATNAGDCRQAVVVQHQQAYYAPATYYPQPFALGIFVPAPTYTVGLSFTDPASAERLEKILNRLDMIEQRLTAPQALPLKQTSAVSCAKCHDGSKADIPKIDFGNLTADQKALASERVLDGSMPPKNQLTKAQRRVVLAEILK